MEALGEGRNGPQKLDSLFCDGDGRRFEVRQFVKEQDTCCQLLKSKVEILIGM